MSAPAHDGHGHDEGAVHAHVSSTFFYIAVFSALICLTIATVGPEQAHLAREAFQRYGKGKHAAKLNLGDCFAYALAKARGEPLLFKGDDFRLTDVEVAI